MSPRLDEVLCAAHQRMLLRTPWEFPSDLNELGAGGGCRRCRVLLAAPGDTYEVYNFGLRPGSPRLVGLFAAHEAGHAVAAHTLGITVTETVLCSGDHRDGGYTRTEWDTDEPPALDRMVVAWAGWCATVRCLRAHGLTSRADMLGAAHGSRADAWLCRRIAATHRRLRPAAGRDLAARLVNQQWARIVAVAGCLAHRGHLTGGQVADIVRGVG
jgi:hypothetical protein